MWPGLKLVYDMRVLYITVSGIYQTKLSPCYGGLKYKEIYRDYKKIA